MSRNSQTRSPGFARARLLAGVVSAALCVAMVVACGTGGPVAAGILGDETMSAAARPAPSATTDGPHFSPPEEVLLAPSALTREDATETGAIDTANSERGYVTVAVTSPRRVKFQVARGEMGYNYDIPTDGTPATIPLNMGDGSYSFRVMQNTSDANYVELSSAEVDVRLEDEFAPFLRPNMLCSYDASSACVEKARELVAGARNEGDALQAICDYVSSNVSYDHEKAGRLSTTSGYVPDPDETLATGTGICLDYASLGAAMLRSVGIPCRIVTGYVSPDDIYHAWIVVYIDGSWRSGSFSVDQDEWTRIDLTFAASSDAEQLVGDGKTYTDRYTY